MVVVETLEALFNNCSEVYSSSISIESNASAKVKFGFGSPGDNSVGILLIFTSWISLKNNPYSSLQ